MLHSRNAKHSHFAKSRGDLRMDSKKYGEYAFLAGLALAVVLGVFASFLPLESKPILFGVLGVLGLVVGFLNITEKEMTAFLVAAVALLLIPSALQPIVGLLVAVPGGVVLATALLSFLSALAAFIAPAAFVNAIKAIYTLAKTD